MSESMREQIFVALIAKLLTITKAASYYNDVRQVYDPPVDLNKMNEFPSVNIIEGQETCAISEIVGGHGALLPNYFDVDFDCVLNEINTPRQARSRMLADIQKLLGINYQIPTPEDVGTASNCQYKGSAPWGVQGTRPLVGITISYRVWYRQRVNNPVSN